MRLTRRSRKLRAAKQPEAKALRITGPVVVHAAAKPEEGKPAGPGTFEAAPAYSGGRLPGYTAGLDHDVVVDLAGLKETPGLKANLDHQPKQRVGHVTEVVNDRKTLTVRGVFSAATSHRDEIVLSAADEFPWETSIETLLDRIVPLAAGKTAVINGQTQTGPLYIARKSRLVGLGFTGNGADPGNKLKIAASAATKGKAMEFETWLTDNGFDNDTITDAQRTILRASFDASKAQNPPPSGGNPPANRPPSAGEILGARRLEAQRREQIRIMADKAFDVDIPDDGERIELLAQQAIDESWSVDQFQLRLLQSSRERPQPRFEGRYQRRDKQVQKKVYEAALLQAAGFPELEKEYDADTLQAIDDSGLRNVRLQTLILRAASANGFVCRPGDGIHAGNIQEVLEYAFPPKSAMLRASNAHSTIDLPSILGNVANKEITSGFAMEDQEWRELAVIKPVNNFYKRTVHSLLDDVEFQPLTNTGEIQHGKLSERTYERQAKTHAIMLGLSREDIINDDAGAFDDIRERIGRGSGRNLNRRFWTAWLAGIAGGASAFWSTAKGNKVEHANSTLLIDGVGLQMILTAFFKLTTGASDGNKRVSGRPVLLVVPPELMFVADRFYQSLNLTGTGSEVPDANIHANKYKPVVVPQLSDASYAGASSTHWWLLRSPSIAPGMVVSALGGRVEPTIESAAADFNRLGVQFRGHSDVGCDRAEDLCGVMSKGAA